MSSDDRAKAFAEVRALIVGCETRNPWSVLDRISQLVGGSPPSEWAEHLARVEAHPKTWAVPAKMRLHGERGVRVGDRVPCEACVGEGSYSGRVCDKCEGDAFIVVREKL